MSKKESKSLMSIRLQHHIAKYYLHHLIPFSNSNYCKLIFIFSLQKKNTGMKHSENAMYHQCDSIFQQVDIYVKMISMFQSHNMESLPLIFRNQFQKYFLQKYMQFLISQNVLIYQQKKGGDHYHDKYRNYSLLTSLRDIYLKEQTKPNMDQNEMESNQNSRADNMLRTDAIEKDRLGEQSYRKKQTSYGTTSGIKRGKNSSSSSSSSSAVISEHAINAYKHPSFTRDEKQIHFIEMCMKLIQFQINDDFKSTATCINSVHDDDDEFTQVCLDDMENMQEIPYYLLLCILELEKRILFFQVLENFMMRKEETIQIYELRDYVATISTCQHHCTPQQQAIQDIQSHRKLECELEAFSEKNQKLIRLLHQVHCTHVYDFIKWFTSGIMLRNENYWSRYAKLLKQSNHIARYLSVQIRWLKVIQLLQFRSKCLRYALMKQWIKHLSHLRQTFIKRLANG